MGGWKVQNLREDGVRALLGVIEGSGRMRNDLLSCTVYGLSYIILKLQKTLSKLFLKTNHSDCPCLPMSPMVYARVAQLTYLNVVMLGQASCAASMLSSSKEDMRSSVAESRRRVAAEVALSEELRWEVKACQSTP